MFFNLECYLVGDRSYIQGSQIIAHAIKHLIYAQGDQRFSLTGAKFTNITQNQVFASSDLDPDFDSDLTSIGQLEFADEQGDELMLFLFAGSTPIVKKVADRQSDYSDLRDIEKLNGQASFEHSEASLQNLFCSIVAANKELHRRLGETVHDIWFTGLNKLQLPCIEEEFVAKGSIEFKHMFTAGKQQRQTMSRVTVKNEQDQPVIPTFVIIFAYKT